MHTLLVNPNSKDYHHPQKNILHLPKSLLSYCVLPLKSQL